jgi:death-on-curing protein
LAAAYAYGIIRNHPFVDGNKRTGFPAAYVFPGEHFTHKLLI